MTITIDQLNCKNHKKHLDIFPSGVKQNFETSWKFETMKFKVLKVNWKGQYL